MFENLKNSHPDKQDLRIRLGILILQIIQLVVFLSLMMSQTEMGPTLDDSWIHYQFARNMAEYGEVSFNRGEWNVGTTSLLWDVILALGILIGLPVVGFSLFLGIVAYLLAAQFAYSVFRSYWEEGWYPLLAVLFVIFSGTMIWFSLSGMETMMMIALSLWWVIEFSRKKYLLAGLITGALILTRIEGMLFLIIGLFFIIRDQGWKNCLKPIFNFLILCLPLLLSSIVLNIMVAGEIYPTTMAGKKWLYGLENTFFNSSGKRAFSYVFVWMVTFIQNIWFPEFMDRPTTLFVPFFKLIYPHRMGEKNLDAIMQDAYPMGLQLIIYLIGILILIIMILGFIKTLQKVFKDFIHGKELTKWEYLFIYVLCLNLLYFLTLPLRGHGGRYQAINFILAGMFLAAAFSDSRLVNKVFRGRFKSLIIGVVLILYIAGTGYWTKIYSYSVYHVNNVHCAAGKWLKQNLPPDTVIGVFDVGAVKYFSELYVLDVAGLTDKEALDYVFSANILEYLRMRDAEYLVMVEDYLWSSERGGERQLYLDSSAYDKLGIRKELGVTVSLEKVNHFSIPESIWKIPWNTLRTHSPMLAIYKIHWLEEENRSPTDENIAPENKPPDNLRTGR